MSDSPFWNKCCSKMCGCLWSQASLGEFFNGWEGLLDEKITHYSFGRRDYPFSRKSFVETAPIRRPLQSQRSFLDYCKDPNRTVGDLEYESLLGCQSSAVHWPSLKRAPAIGPCEGKTVAAGKQSVLVAKV